MTSREVVDFLGVTIKSVQRSHNRDFNASVNLERLATATAGSSCGTTALPGAIGKVTSVSDEVSQQGTSGQKPLAREGQQSAHLCALFG